MKKLIIGLIILAVVGGGAYLIFSDQTSVDVSFVAQDESDLNAWFSDLDRSDQDETAATEMDQTIAEILDEPIAVSTGASGSAALDEAAINQEASQADLSQTLDATAADEATLKEMDQVYNEVSN